MEENTANLQAPPKLQRPLGVWILTIFALFTGIAPLILYIYLIISRNNAGDPITILISTAVSIGIIITSIGAWLGKNIFRIALLILITIYYVLIGFSNLLMLNSGQIAFEGQILLCGRVVRGILYPAIYIWYFNKRTTKEFFSS
jgi:hypothetical protein